MKSLPNFFNYLNWRIGILMLLFSLGHVFVSTGQSFTNYKTASNKVLKQYQKGKALQKVGSLAEAEKSFLQALRADDQFIDAYIRLGDIQVDRKNYKEALTYYSSALALNPDYSDRILYVTGMLEYELEHYDLALEKIQHYIDNGTDKGRISNAEKSLANLKFAQNAIKNPVPFQPKRLSSLINTTVYEYLPSFTADGQSLVFTRRGKGIKGQEDFFLAEKIDNEWQQAMPIYGINTPDNEGAQTMSADGKTLIFTGCNRREGFGSCDLYISYKKEDSWTTPVNLGRAVNSQFWDSHPSLSANGDILIFASNRSGGLGKSDLYICYRDLEGTWSSPENMGPMINTSDLDQFPFFHADSRTLYFVSKGHLGMGGFDIFRSKLLGDGAWSTPINMGYPINTKADESTLIVSHDGVKGYFASNRFNVSLSTTDIYEFELYPEARPEPVTYVKATVIDAETEEKLPNASIELFDAGTGKILYTKQTDEQGGFLISLASGRSYGLNVEKRAYLFHSENFDLQEQRSLENPFELIIPLQPITRELYINPEIKAEPVILRNVFFATGSADLLPVSLTELERLFKLLLDNPSMKIRIEGHTDNVGTPEDNETLSQARAIAVLEYLVNKGILEERLAAVGYGERKPIASNDAADGRQSNRRTAFMIIQ